MFTICRKDSDQFEGWSKISTGWFILDSGFLKRNFLQLKQTSITFYYEKSIEDQDMLLYKTFFIPFDFTKLGLNNINDPVKNIASSSDKDRKSKEKVVAPICGKTKLPKYSIKTQKVPNGPNLITQSEAT